MSCILESKLCDLTTQPARKEASIKMKQFWFKQGSGQIRFYWPHLENFQIWCGIVLGLIHRGYKWTHSQRQPDLLIRTYLKVGKICHVCTLQQISPSSLAQAEVFQLHLLFQIKRTSTSMFQCIVTIKVDKDIVLLPMQFRFVKKNCNVESLGKEIHLPPTSVIARTPQGPRSMHFCSPRRWNELPKNASISHRSF